MEAERYQSFLDTIVSSAEADERIVGVVVLGSGAGVVRQPDEFSDHDVWLITVDGTAPAVRESTEWLPEPDRIVAHLADTQHGRSAVYDDGHLIELAVFEIEELDVTRANEYRVLYDAADIAERLAAVAERTSSEMTGVDPDYSAQRFVAQLLIGLGRLGRGEHMSANYMIREWAANSLLQSLAAGATDQLDNLDPHRRIEQALPAVAPEVVAALEQPLVDVARSLMDIAARQGVLDGVVLRAVEAAFERAAAGASAS